MIEGVICRNLRCKIDDLSRKRFSIKQMQVKLMKQIWLARGGRNIYWQFSLTRHIFVIPILCSVINYVLLTMNTKQSKGRQFMVVAEGWNDRFDKKTILDYLRQYNVTSSRKEFPQTNFRKRPTLLLFYDSLHMAEEAKTRLCNLNKKQMLKLQVRLRDLPDPEQTYPYVDRSADTARVIYAPAGQQPRLKIRLPTLNEYQKNTSSFVSSSNQEQSQPYHSNRSKKDYSKPQNYDCSASPRSANFKKYQGYYRNSGYSKPTADYHSRSRSRERGLQKGTSFQKVWTNIDRFENSRIEQQLIRNNETSNHQQIISKGKTIDKSETSSHTIIKDLKRFEQNTQSASNHITFQNTAPDFTQDLSSGISGNDFFQASSLTNTQLMGADSQNQNLSQKNFPQTQQMLVNLLKIDQVNKQKIDAQLVVPIPDNKDRVNQVISVQNMFEAKATQVEQISRQFKADILREKEMINLFLRRVPSHLRNSELAIYDHSIDAIDILLNSAANSGTPRKRKS